MGEEQQEIKGEVAEHPAEKRLPPVAPELGPEPGVEPGERLRFWAALRGLPERLKDAGGAWRQWVQVLWLPALIFVLSYTAYALYSWDRYERGSEDTHFIYQAHVFFECWDAAWDDEKDCTFELHVDPPHGNDWASYIDLPVKGDEVLTGIWVNRDQHKFKTLDGKLYIIESEDRDHRKRVETHTFVSFPPGPAMVMMPLLAMTEHTGRVRADRVFVREKPGGKRLGEIAKDETVVIVGHPEKRWTEIEFEGGTGYVESRNLLFTDVNDVKLTIFFAALNVLLFFLLLQRLSAMGVSFRSRRENALLAFLFGFSTNVLWCSVLGQVWFTALVLGITFTLLYMHTAIGTRHPLAAGIFLALAMATRTPLAFSFVFFAYFLFFPNGRLRRGEWASFFRKGLLFATPILAMGFFLMWMNHVRFGNAFEFGHTYLAQGGLYRIQRYGLFNYHFLSKNLFAAFALLPRVQPYEPYVIVSEHGMSLFLTTPALVYLLAYRSGFRRIDRKWFWATVLTVLAVAVPGFFYQNTGWAQFGFRFSLDYTPYLVLLIALNRRRIGALFVALVIAGFLVNSFGAITFGRAAEHYEGWMIDPDR